MALSNKMDELSALIRTQREYRECSVLCFTETWLHEDIPECSNASIPGFQSGRSDRDRDWVVRNKGGGVMLFVNNRWCNLGLVTVKEHHCSANVVLLAVGLCPYYLPREFTVALCYCIHPTSSWWRSSMWCYTLGYCETPNWASKQVHCHFRGFLN